MSQLTPENSFIGWCLPSGKSIQPTRWNYAHSPVCTIALTSKQKERAIKGAIVPGLWVNAQKA